MQRQLLQLYTTTISRLKLHFTSCTRDFSGGKHAPSYFRPGHHSSKSSSLAQNRKFAIILLSGHIGVKKAFAEMG